jgi:hypothetical protein
MKWNINLYYGLKTGRKKTHAGVDIKRMLEGLNLKHIGDNVYSGEVTEHLRAAQELGKVLELLADPKTPSKPRFLVLTIHAKP